MTSTATLRQAPSVHPHHAYGTTKLGQNKAVVDRAAVVAGLRALADAMERA